MLKLLSPSEVQAKLRSTQDPNTETALDTCISHLNRYGCSGCAIVELIEERDALELFTLLKYQMIEAGWDASRVHIHRSVMYAKCWFIHFWR